MLDSNSLKQVTAAVLQKSKYTGICPAFIERIATQELKKRRTIKEAVKSTCSKLHQVGGAFLENRPDLSEWEQELIALPPELNSPQVMQFCLSKMESHTSTRERAPILRDFFAHTLAGFAPIHSILDLGCGLNVLALPWMPLVQDPIYQGLDIFQDLLDFSTKFLQHFRLRGRMQCADILTSLPKQHAQLALALKILPVLEQIEKNTIRDWLESIPAEHLLISYPVASLGGRSKGMPAHYTEQFNQLVQNLSWQIQRFDFQTEIAFLIHRGG